MRILIVRLLKKRNLYAWNHCVCYQHNTRFQFVDDSRYISCCLAGVQMLFFIIQYSILEPAEYIYFAALKQATHRFKIQTHHVHHCSIAKHE